MTDGSLIEQDWGAYTADEHAIWRALFQRQAEVLARRACREFLDGLQGLGVAADGIPDFRRLNDVLRAATGWRIVAVPGLVPDEVFFAHLANRRFPSTCFVRRADQLDYLQEPDVFHDIFGHVPMLMNPIFAEALETEAELAAFGGRFKQPKVANMMPKTPVKSRAELKAMGFDIVTYNVLIHAAVRALQQTLKALKANDMASAPPLAGFDEVTRLVGLPDYLALEQRYKAG